MGCKAQSSSRKRFVLTSHLLSVFSLICCHVFAYRGSDDKNFDILDRVSEIFKSSSNRNIVYLIVNCQSHCLFHVIQLLEDVNSRRSIDNVNVINIGFSTNATRPSVFTRTYEQLRESLENIICESSITQEASSNIGDFYSTLSKIISEMQAHDSILWFSCDHENVSRFFSTVTENSKEKEIHINIVWTKETKIPQDYIELGQQTGGEVLKYAGSPFRIRELSSISEEKRNYVSENLNSYYEVETINKNLEHDTRTLFSLPEGTFQIYLTINGDITKALLISSMGIAINILPTNDDALNSQNIYSNWKYMNRNKTFTFNLPITVSPTSWTLSANGKQYQVTLLMLIAKKKMNIGSSNNYYKNRDFFNDDFNNMNKMEENFQKFRHQNNFTEAKHLSSNTQALHKRQDIYLDNESPNIGVQSNNFLTTFNNLPTIITVDQQSTFYAFPGEEARIIFNVRNNKLIPSSYSFHCYYPSQPCYVQPQYSNLMPQQTIPVVVVVKAEGSDGSLNVVSLIAQSTEVIDKKVYLHIGKQRSDTTKPDIDYDFNGNCDEADSGYSCQRKQWSVNVYAQDTESGLLNFWSEPPALIYTTEFIVGTFDKVSARYSASCCDPKVDIIAVDIRGNTYKRTLDVTHQYLNWIEITAIVLGSILLLIILAIVIYCLIRWKKKRDEKIFLNSSP